MKILASTSRLIDRISAAVLAIPLSIVGIFTFVNSAQASSFTGQFQLNSGYISSPNTEEYSLVELSTKSLIFSPQPVTPIALSYKTGSFTAFNTANIGNIIQFSPLSVDNPFLDFGKTLLSGIVQSAADIDAIADGINTFTLSSASYELKQSGANVAIDVALSGLFSGEAGAKSQGAGNLTFQVNNAQVANVESILKNGGSVKNLAFSGALFTTTSVPEPATLLGLGLVSATIAISRRRKSQEDSMNISKV